MSGPSTPTAQSSSTASRSLPGALPGIESVLRPIEAFAFWTAIVMPFIYLPLLLTGVETPSEAIAFGVLVAAHVVALVVGRRYTPDR